MLTGNVACDNREHIRSPEIKKNNAQFAAHCIMLPIHADCTSKWMCFGGASEHITIALGKNWIRHKNKTRESERKKNALCSAHEKLTNTGSVCAHINCNAMAFKKKAVEFLVLFVCSHRVLWWHNRWDDRWWYKQNWNRNWIQCKKKAAKNTWQQ